MELPTRYKKARTRTPKEMYDSACIAKKRRMLAPIEQQESLLVNQLKANGHSCRDCARMSKDRYSLLCWQPEATRPKLTDLFRICKHWKEKKNANTG